VVEHDLAKVGVEGSNPFARSRIFDGKAERMPAVSAGFSFFAAHLGNAVELPSPIRYGAARDRVEISPGRGGSRNILSIIPPDRTAQRALLSGDGCDRFFESDPNCRLKVRLSKRSKQNDSRSPVGLHRELMR
jgi:hypothetical protein